MVYSDDDEEEEDMFCDDFEEKQTAKKLRLADEKSTKVTDYFADPDGYYLISGNEVLRNRYELRLELGRGAFGNVVKAFDRREQVFVAIKIIRKNMHASGLKELQFLQKCSKEDPHGKMHVVQLLDHFDFHEHLCIVLELLNMNLRDLLKKFGRNQGIRLQAVRAYAHQLFQALAVMEKCGIIHADIKPDNIVVSENRLSIRLCDFGTAVDLTTVRQTDPTPYLVSRYYRAPEIILGIPFDYAADMWSVGCTLYELYTGHILFTGRNNNDMIKLFMDYKGKFPHKMLRRAKELSKYFDEKDNYAFLQKQIDPITNLEISSRLHIGNPTKDIKSGLFDAVINMQEERELMLSFADLLDQCFALNPEKRLTWQEAIRHPFIQQA